MTIGLLDAPAIGEAEQFKLTSKQKEALGLIGSEALYIMLYGGSRSTKTFTIIRTIVWRALAVNNSRHAILRFRFSHVKASVFYDTFPKVMRLCFPDCPYKDNKEDWFVRFPNGSEIWFGGLDDKERTEKILGREYCTIFLNETSQISYDSFLIMFTRLAQLCTYTDKQGQPQELRLKMFLDENPPTKGHWTYKLFIRGTEPKTGERLGRPVDYGCLLMNPVDNLENLPESYIRGLKALPKTQRDRFWLGKFNEDAAGALWTPETIAAARLEQIPDDVTFSRVVVAVDPSGAGDVDEEEHDEIGIAVCALGTDGIGYFLEDLSLLAGPKKWGGVVASAYTRHMADRVVGEKNYGGAMVEFTCRAANPNISYKGVNATRGKVIRAEPISALTELKKIKFVGKFDTLEDELCGFTTRGYIGDRSPNRADAFVWGFTELFPGMAVRDKRDDSAPIHIPIMKRI
jgi:phage terminase large subunit-like protein